MRSIWVFGEPLCQRVGVDVHVCDCVSVRGTVQVGPNCEKGAKASWASVQCPLGPAELKEWGISSNPKTKSQRKRGKSLAGLAAGHPATRLDYETLETSAVVEDKRKGLLFHPNDSPNLWTTLPASIQDLQAFCLNESYQNQQPECRKSPNNTQNNLSLIS